VPPIIRIQDIAQYDGQEVIVRGWVKARTGKGKLQFIRLRDGSGQVQCVAFKKEMDEDNFAEVKTLTQESAIQITGTVRADERAPGIPGGYEIGVSPRQNLPYCRRIPHHAQRTRHRIFDG
jgi:asparaginyl-tRNA synthetase